MKHGHVCTALLDAGPVESRNLSEVIKSVEICKNNENDLCLRQGSFSLFFRLFHRNALFPVLF